MLAPALAVLLAAVISVLQHAPRGYATITRRPRSGAGAGAVHRADRSDFDP